MNLIIVESPTKANTFNKFLKGKDFHVEATLGHIRDLPENKLSIDIEHDFKPDYIITKKKKDVVDKITSLAKKADTIILATDSDREGEAISYHIAYLLKFVNEKWPKATIKKTSKLKRIVFHEITQSALKEALSHPSEINLKLVNAQHTRRILDRLVGYKISPLLWKKIGKRWLSAGRVQTVALRFIVEREKEIEKFSKEDFYRALGIFSKKNSEKIEAKLVAKDGELYEKKTTIKLFDGDYTYSKTSIEKPTVDSLKKDIESDSFTVEDVKERVYKRTPPPPFTTSTLQQEAAYKLGYSSKMTMRTAQSLYEKGYITYHRTDSVSLSEKFLKESRKYIEKEFGNEYLPDSSRMFKTKSKLAQEAHEAIRPTKLVPSIDTKEGLSSSHKKLYALIFKRATASQMKEANVRSVKLSIISSKKYLFESSFEEIVFDGYLKLYNPKKTQIVLPFKKGDEIDLDDITFTESQTMPPPRYSEPSLIRTLESRGIGRPSTYAPTISTIQDRMYVEKLEGRFHPTMLGTTVCDYLSKSFSDIFAIDFTANLEDDLDNVADGKKDMVTVLKEFDTPLEKQLEKAKKDKGYIDVQEKTDEKCPDCGKLLLIRISKYGKFYGCSGYPDCKYTRQYFETVKEPCPKCGGTIVIKYTKKKRKFFGCSNYPKCDFAAWKLKDITEQDTKLDKAKNNSS